MKIHGYRYKKPLLERLKQGSYTGEIPLLRFKVGKKIVMVHTTFKEKRRDVKAINEEIKKTEAELEALEKRPALNRKERERVDFLEGHIPILRAERDYVENLEYCGDGVVVIGDGMHQHLEEDSEAA